MKRRHFIKTVAAGGAAAVLPVIPSINKLYAQDGSPQVIWVENGEPADLVNTAFIELGGITRFISKGDVVVIKPNIGWDRNPELAATTNPEVVAAVVELCKKAGADEIKIFDRTCNNPRRCYRNSKIEKMAKAAGADVYHMRDNKYKDIDINGKIIKSWPIYSEYLEADKIINIPIAKHHSLSKVTLGLKNLMGVMGGNRGSLHNDFSQKITDINKNLLPSVTLIDAYRILTANGPSGGNPDHVRLTKTLVASSCTVSADATALELFNHKLTDVDHIKLAADNGLAKYDLTKLNVKRIALG